MSLVQGLPMMLIVVIGMSITKFIYEILVSKSIAPMTSHMLMWRFPILRIQKYAQEVALSHCITLTFSSLLVRGRSLFKGGVS